MNTWRILHGDVRERLRSLPSCFRVNCVVTSPPYWGLRDYGVPGQLGLEPTPDAYVAAMVDVFRAVRDKLADDGTCWLNLGDCYQSGSRGGYDRQRAGVSKNCGQNASDFAHAPNRMPQDGLKDKDLVGIPWRVAFALQQPQVDNVIKREADRAWLAALVDGEGTMTILQTTSPHGSGDSFPPVLQVRMCDVECIARAAGITGFGKASPRQDPPSQGGVRSSYQWRINGSKAAKIAADIYPHLCIKRQQAVILWNHQRIRDSYETKRGVCIPREAVEKQQMCRDLIKRLNRREVVDIPSWMDEPTVEVTPGWYLRSDVIWSKPNPMPESVTDRPTKAHEYIFLLTKRERYFYNAAAIREPYSPSTLREFEDGYQGTARKDYAGTGAQNASDVKRRIVDKQRGHGRRHAGFNDRWDAMPKDEQQMGGANKRSVWRVATQPYPEAHFATFPEKLVEPCILAGTKPDDTVMDPFCGSGTTGAVAIGLGRNFIGVELNADYIALARQRISNVAPLLAREELTA